MSASSSAATPQHVHPTDLSEVSAEIKSTVERRRDVINLYATMYAAMSVYFDKLAFGEKPTDHSFLGLSPLSIYLMVMCALGAICAVRLARLHYGMVRNGIYFAAIKAQSIKPEDFVKSEDRDPRTLKKRGVSTLFVLLTSCMASVTLGCLVGYWLDSLPIAGLAALVALVALMAYFGWGCHKTAVRDAMHRLDGWKSGMPSTFEGIERQHEINTLEMCQKDMLAIITTMGLLVFGLFQTMSELEKQVGVNITHDQATAGNLLGALGILISSVISIITYARLRRAVTESSRSLQQNDSLGWISDSGLGFVLLLIIALLAWHTCLTTMIQFKMGPSFAPNNVLMIISGLAMVVLASGWYRREARAEA